MIMAKPHVLCKTKYISNKFFKELNEHFVAMGDKFQSVELVYSYYDASIPMLSLTIDGCPPRRLQDPHLSSAHGHRGIAPI